MSMGEKKTHPSFGIISITRGSYGRGLSNRDKMSLFASSIQHTSFVTIRINRACLIRDLHSDRVFDEGSPIVEVQMSPSQFADAITTLNQQPGTPCTIKFVDDRSVEDPPFDSKRVQFDAEFDAKMRKIASDTNQYYAKIREVLSKPSIAKRDRDEIMSQLRLLRQEIEANIPFIKTEFTEQMDQTVVEAKNDFTAFIEGRLKELGMENLKGKLSLEFMPDKEGERDGQ